MEVGTNFAAISCLWVSFNKITVENKLVTNATALRSQFQTNGYKDPGIIMGTNSYLNGTGAKSLDHIKQIQSTHKQQFSASSVFIWHMFFFFITDHHNTVRSCWNVFYFWSQIRNQSSHSPVHCLISLAVVTGTLHTIQSRKLALAQMHLCCAVLNKQRADLDICDAKTIENATRHHQILWTKTLVQSVKHRMLLNDAYWLYCTRMFVQSKLYPQLLFRSGPTTAVGLLQSINISRNQFEQQLFHYAVLSKFSHFTSSSPSRYVLNEWQRL